MLTSLKACIGIIFIIILVLLYYFKNYILLYYYYKACQEFPFILTALLLVMGAITEAGCW